MHRNLRPNLDQRHPRSKSLGAKGQTIDTEREIPHDVVAVCNHPKGAVKLIGGAYQLATWGQCGTLWVAHFDAQLAACMLSPATGAVKKEEENYEPSSKPPSPTPPDTMLPLF